jgi:hypothetical protein
MIRIVRACRRRLVVIAVPMAALAATGFLAVGDEAGAVASVSPTGDASSFAVAMTTPVGVASAFPRSDVASAADALPAATVQSVEIAGGFGEQYGVNPALAQWIGTVDGRAVWLVPGASGSCMWVGSLGMVCADNSQVASEGLVMVLVPVEGGASRAIGIVPTGATLTATNADGSNASFTTSNQAYAVVADSPAMTIAVDLHGGGVANLGVLSSDAAAPGRSSPSSGSAP